MQTPLICIKFYLLGFSVKVLPGQHLEPSISSYANIRQTCELQFLIPSSM